MKVAIFILLVLALQAQAQQSDHVGFEVGGTADLNKLPSLYTRLSYSSAVSTIRFDAGGLILFGRDGSFGFDVLITRPIRAFEPLVGARFLVWERSMSTGFPVGGRWHYRAGSAELTFGVTVAPTLHLAAEESNTVLFDTFIGVSF